jgi:TusA-related sulfurtransferase
MITLDLREERCPLALLLAKRNIAKLTIGERLDILVTDSSSMGDIISYIERQPHTMKLDNLENWYCITVIMEK